MMPAYVYGDSYGGVAAQERGLDAARDQRLFQSLASRRANTAMMLDELQRRRSMAMAQQQQMRQRARDMAELQRSAHLDVLRQQQLAEDRAEALRHRRFQEGLNLQNLKRQQDALALSRERFDFDRAEPPSVVLANEFRMAREAAERDRMVETGQRLADMLNEASALRMKASKIGSLRDIAVQGRKGRRQALAELSKIAPELNVTEETDDLVGALSTAANELEAKAKLQESQTKRYPRQAMGLIQNVDGRFGVVDPATTNSAPQDLWWDAQTGTFRNSAP